MSGTLRSRDRSWKFPGISIGAVLGLALISAIAAAQTTKPAPQIRVATRLIQVNVIVNDKKGEPVSGLTKDDFMLLDQGQPQKIAFLSEEADHPPATVAPSLPAAPNVFSNESQQRPGMPISVTVILLDSLNTSFLDMGFARERVIKFLHQVRPEDRIALYALSDKLLVLHDFTQDTGALLRALDSYKNKPNTEFAASDFTLENRGSADSNLFANMDKLLGGRALSDFETVDRIQVTADALEAIADHLASLTGRKNLVWVSGSFPINIGTLPRRGMAARTQKFSSDQAVEEAARSLNNGNIAIYPVDARGMIMPTGLSEEYAMGPKSPSGLPTRGAAVQMDPPQENFTVMDQLAEDTGGRAFYNANDIEVSIRRAIDDSRDSYVLSYYPAIEKWDGSFHEIKVQVKQPGVQVRSRRGYYAFPDATPDANRQNQQIADAVAAPLESAALGLTVQADPAGTAGVRKLRVHIRVDSSRMLFQQKDERWTDHLDLVWAQIGANGETIASSSEGLNLHMSPETYAATEQDGLKISTTLDIRDDAGALRLVARDAGTGAIGSLDIPLDKIFPKPKTPAAAHP